MISSGRISIDTPCCKSNPAFAMNVPCSFTRFELHTWVGSSKRVKLHGTFIAKAGFDLQQGVSIDIRPEEIIVQLPHAKILGVEQKEVDVLAFENGLWNRISGQDVEDELSALPQLAWKKAV